MKTFKDHELLGRLIKAVDELGYDHHTTGISVSVHFPHGVHKIRYLYGTMMSAFASYDPSFDREYSVTTEEEQMTFLRENAPKEETP